MPMLTVTFKMPEKLFPTVKDARVAATKAVNTAVRASKRDFDDTIATFSNDSKFAFKVQRAHTIGATVEGSVSTTNENYRRLNDGTRRHLVGKGGKWMSYMSTYMPKTYLFGKFRSRSGGPGGTRQRAKGPWYVEGIEKRNYSYWISLKHRDKFYANCTKWAIDG